MSEGRTWTSGDLAVMVEGGEIDFCYLSTVRFAKWVPELAKLDPSMNEVIRLTDAERAAFVKASQPVLDKHRKELDTELFAYLGA